MRRWSSHDLDADIAAENRHVQREIVDDAAGPAVDENGDGPAAADQFHFLARQRAAGAALVGCRYVLDCEILDGVKVESG